MYISRLRLKGFKSFGGNHEIELSPGYTAIVGPNGSGKSNILDAIRWVLGDPTPARLRIQRQSDLLFQGSISLNPSNEVESILQLSDISKSVTIRRTYSTVKGTLFMVDGEKVRLQDLQEIKSGFRLEGEQFAFIGQGEVAEAIRHRPFQRRLHLESLFGIEKYRKKRDDANRKLDLASSELLRLQTLMSELQSRRKQIEPHVRKASQARVVLEELEEQRKFYYFTRISFLQAKHESLSIKEKRLQNEAAGRIFWSDIWSKSLDKYRRKKKEIEEGLNLRYETIDKILTVRENLFRQCFITATSLKNARQRIDVINKEERQLQEDLAALKKETQSSSKGVRMLQSDLQNRLSVLDLLKDECVSKEKIFEDQEKQRRDQTRYFTELRQQKGQITVKIETLIRSLRNLKNRKTQLEQEIVDLERKARNQNDKQDLLASRSVSLTDQHSQIFTQCRNIAGNLQILKKEQRNLEVLIDDLRATVEEKGYPEPVRFLTSGSRLGRLNVSPVPLIEIFTAPTRLAQGLDSFLGGRLFWLIVENMDEAQICIDYLKKRGAGRVTMLPLDRCRPKLHNGTDLDHKSGVIGWAIDLISVEDKWLPALEHLIGDVLFVETFVNARELVSQRVRFPVVTLDGEVFSPQGHVSGGFRRRGPGIVEQKLELEKKKNIFEENISRIKMLSIELDHLEKKEQNFAELKEKINLQLHDLSSSLKQNNIQLSSFRSELNHVGDVKVKSNDNLILFWEKRRKIQLEYRSLGIKMVSDTLDSTDISQLKVQLSQEENKVNLLKEKLKSSNQIIKRIAEEKTRLERTLLEIQSEKCNLEALIIESLGKLKNNGLYGLELWSDLNAERLKIRLDRESMENYGRKLNSITSRYNGASEILRLLENDQNRLENDRLSVQRDMEQLLEMWGDKFTAQDDLDLSQVDQADLQNRIRVLEKKIRGFGEIDQGCLSEDSSLKERISYLEEQTHDIITGSGQLKNMIENLDKQVEQIFRGALQKVDRRFDSLFKRLFGGGEAHLTIQESHSIWDCGVDIIARPPGKKMQNLNQLSGGEQSLTAISLLFASMEVAEVPLAILDEVDAALDDVNLGRFVDLILDYSTSLQLVIMTHRRITMENANIMYGVTMKEPGLSQIVGVKLDDWK